MKQICQNCAWAKRQDGIFGSWYCTRMTKTKLSGEYYVGVSPRDTCNHFMEKDTPENSGYKKSSDCFLTSACCEYLGKPDDCTELTKLRSFRDNYLKESENGKKLVEEYYKIAPGIVKKINLSLDKEKYYSYIYQTIQKCIIHIDAKEPNKALDTYKAMVLYLKGCI